MYDEYADEAPMTEQAQPPADKQMIELLTRQLRDAEKGNEYHRIKADEHQQRADEASRCIKAAHSALEVLQPSMKAMDVEAIGKKLAEVEGRSGQVYR